MSQSRELKKTKKIYGEKFSHLCRELFPLILEQEGMLLQILQEKFSKNCNTLYETIEEYKLVDVDNFKELIYQSFDKSREEECEKDEKRNPYEILDEAGYELYECLTEEDMQKYERYYAPNEVLCTIFNGGRLNSRVCFWAVKKDVDKIKREDFKHPKKGDEYSTSVLAIQFDKSPNSNVEIISRYNHTVPNPNCTLNNNLDNIAEGLQKSFTRILEERGYHLNKTQKTDFEIPGYTLAGDGKYYKYNLEINGKYYCPGNIVIENGEAREIGKPEETILCDYFKIDLKEAKIESLIEYLEHDSFVDDLKDIEKIEVKKDKEERKKIIHIHKKREEETSSQEPIVIELNNDNQIIGYINKDIKTIGNNFLRYNKALTELSMPQVQAIGDYFLYYNKTLTELNMPQVEDIRDYFLYKNEALTELNMPQVEDIGDYFLNYNEALTELNMPQVQAIGNCFLYYNKALTGLNMPQVEAIGDYFLNYNEALTELSMPQVQAIGDHFLSYNEALTELNMPQVEVIGDCFLEYNKILPKVVEEIKKLSRIKYITPKEALKSALEQITTTKSSVQNVIQAEKNQSQIDTTKEGEILDEYY